MSHASELEQTQSTETAAALPAEIVMPKFWELTRRQICWMLGSSAFFGALAYFAWSLNPSVAIMVSSFGIGWNIQEYITCLREAAGRGAKLAWLARLAVLLAIVGCALLFAEVLGARLVIALVGAMAVVNSFLGRTARGNAYLADLQVQKAISG